MMNTNQGNSRSANVHPDQYSCISGGKTADQSPGLLTRIIAAIVTPRKTSSDSRWWATDFTGVLRDHDGMPRGELEWPRASRHTSTQAVTPRVLRETVR